MRIDAPPLSSRSSRLHVACAPGDRLLARLAELYGDPPPAFTVIDPEAGTVTGYVDPEARPRVGGAA